MTIRTYKGPAGTTLFKCSNCGEAIPLGMYAVAQMAMGHELTHTHECGAKHSLRSTAGRYRVKALAPTKETA